MTDIITCLGCCWTGDRDDLVAEATAPDAFNHCPRCSCVTFEVDLPTCADPQTDRNA